MAEGNMDNLNFKPTIQDFFEFNKLVNLPFELGLLTHPIMKTSK